MEKMKTPIKQFRKEYIESGDEFEIFLVEYFIYQIRIVDKKRFNTNQDYVIQERLNPFNPFAYLFIIFLILNGFKKSDGFLQNIREIINSFKWYNL